ncbi:MAG: pyridoxal-phosphate dependent enzyme, partial [Frankiales bacterium]
MPRRPTPTSGCCSRATAATPATRPREGRWSSPATGAARTCSARPTAAPTTTPRWSAASWRRSGWPASSPAASSVRWPAATTCTASPPRSSPSPADRLRRVSTPAALPVGIDDVRAARELLTGISRETPLQGLRGLSDAVGGPVLLKCENLQRTGSFKIRGAYVRIARLSAAERAHGVVAASAGNHAQGVALAASLLGCPSTVFMPESAPLPKVAATKGYGAQVRHAGHTVDEALLAAHAFAAETGAVLIHPFDHVDVVAGQGTVGLEIVEQCPDVRTVVVCTGGGGLVAGIAVAVKALLPDVRIVAAQAEGAAAYGPSLAAGSPVALDTMPSAIVDI